MPNIRPSADLRNHYNEIAEFVKTTGKPIYITKNGHADTTILASREYDRLIDILDFYESVVPPPPERVMVHSKGELYAKIEEAEESIRQGKVYNHQDVISKLHEG